MVLGVTINGTGISVLGSVVSQINKRKFVLITPTDLEFLYMAYQDA